MVMICNRIAGFDDKQEIDGRKVAMEILPLRRYRRLRCKEGVAGRGPRSAAVLAVTLGERKAVTIRTTDARLLTLSGGTVPRDPFPHIGSTFGFRADSGQRSDIFFRDAVVTWRETRVPSLLRVAGYYAFIQ